MRKVFLIFGLSFSIFLTGCNGNYTKEEFGRGLGAAVGGIVGAALGDDSIGEAAGFALGALGGAVLGSMIGNHLDEHDKLKAEVATLTALQLDQDSTVTWTSDKNRNVGGTVSTQLVPSNSSEQCKKVTQVINLNGTEKREESTVCQQPDGSWSLS